jgi:uncharacterized protein YecE (DUF72 family)
VTIVLPGTSGYSFKEWKGNFYPDKLPEKKFLPFYAERLPSVELNNTFYRLPTASAVDGWCHAVPDAFRFSVKAPQRITHLKRLKDVDELVDQFARLVLGFSHKLGVVLFQFPPQFGLNFERLERLGEVWPKTVPTAVEFRNAAWNTPAVRAWFKARGFMWVLNHNDDEPNDPLEETTFRDASGNGQLYLRLRRLEYTQVELSETKHRLSVMDLDRAFVFFKHEISGPRYAKWLLDA